MAYNSTSSGSLTSTDVTWSYWTNATSTSASTTTQIWQTWTSNSVSVTSASTANTVWENWSTSTTTGTSTGSTWRAWANEPVRTFPANAWRPPERRVPSRPRVAPGVARERADKLLVEHLSPEQEASLAAHGYFDVTTMVDGHPRRFRIHNDKYQHNVFELDERGQKIHELCAHTSHACPQSDHALAQKLLLEHNPAEFFRIANIWDVRDGARRQIQAEALRGL